MHELSIAISMVEQAEEEAKSRGVEVTAIHLKLGPLSGVVKEALLSCYDLVTENTALAGSRLVIKEVPILMRCGQCSATRELPSLERFSCPECGGPISDILQGRELEITALEVKVNERDANVAPLRAKGETDG